MAGAERAGPDGGRVLPDLPGTGRLIRHPTGARILVVENADPNLVFGIAFPTLPADSTGVAHILEHAVLSGSAAYPGPSPFAQLMRGSLNTFLNAMTLPDMTLYAVASPHPGEFRTLVDVYLDAVFAPLLTEATFRREAWRIEPRAAGTPAIQGVVYNEMKGHYASARNLAEERLRQALYPDTVYGHDYGGAPEAIPALSHGAMVAFHRRFYVPANALVFCAGQAISSDTLEAICARLDSLAPGTPAPRIAPQSGFAAPRRLRESYPGPRPEPRRDGLVALGWVIEPPPTADERLLWRVLDELLVGAPNAALRRALVESGLGADLVQSGWSDGTLPPSFRVALIGADPAAAGRIEAVARDTLAGLARSGFDPGDVAAALNVVEFRLREGRGGPFPEGIWQMFDAFKGWRVAGDPFAFLDLATAMARLTADVHAGQVDLRAPLALLIASPHRVTLVLAADPDLAARQAEAEAARAAALAGAAAEDAAGVGGAVSADTPAGRAPALLSRGDLPARIDPDPVTLVGTRPAILAQSRATRGIVHLDLALDLSGLAPLDLARARFLGAMLTEAGTARRDSTALARWIGTATGGIRTVPLAKAAVGGGTALRLVLRGKALVPEAGTLASILAELLAEARFDDPARLAEILARERARAEAELTRMGHEVVDRRIRAALTAAGAAAEALAGLGWLDFLRRADPATLGPDLAALLRRIGRRGAVLSLTADPADLDAALAAAAPVSALLAQGGTPLDARFPLPDCPPGEALEAPTAVSFVGMGGDLAAAGFAPTGATAAAIRHLATGWLWDQVREKGGAYGAMARLDPVSGVVTQLSYRDPNLLATVEVFRRSAAQLAGPVAEADLTAALVATVAAEDRPRHAGDAALEAVERWLTGQDLDWRQARRDALLAATAADFRAAGEAMAVMAERVVVLAGPAALDRAEAERPGWLTRTPLLP